MLRLLLALVGLNDGLAAALGVSELRHVLTVSIGVSPTRTVTHGWGGTWDKTCRSRRTL